MMMCWEEKKKKKGEKEKDNNLRHVFFTCKNNYKRSQSVNITLFVQSSRYTNKLSFNNIKVSSSLCEGNPDYYDYYTTVDLVAIQASRLPISSVIKS